MARAIAKSAGAPIVMTAHTDFAYFIFSRFRGDPILKKLFAIWGKHAYSLAKVVIVPSEKAAALFRRYGLADNGCTLVMITRVSREKNIAEILHYFPALLRAMPQAQIIIVGEGPERWATCLYRFPPSKHRG